MYWLLVLNSYKKYILFIKKNYMSNTANTWTINLDRTQEAIKRFHWYVTEVMSDILSISKDKVLENFGDYRQQILDGKVIMKDTSKELFYSMNKKLERLHDSLLLKKGQSIFDINGFLDKDIN